MNAGTQSHYLIYIYYFALEYGMRKNIEIRNDSSSNSQLPQLLFDFLYFLLLEHQFFLQSSLLHRHFSCFHCVCVNSFDLVLDFFILQIATK